MTAPNSVLSIRKATPHDIAIIHQIAHDTWPHTYRDILTPEQLHYMLDFFYDPAALQQQMADGQQFFLAAYDDGVIGFAAVSEHQPGTWKLNKIYVLPQFQQTGAGKALLQEAIRIARASGAGSLILNVNRNNKAIGFYERQGFRIIASEDVSLGNGVVQEDYVMALELSR